MGVLCALRVLLFLLSCRMFGSLVYGEFWLPRRCAHITDVLRCSGFEYCNQNLAEICVRCFLDHGLLRHCCAGPLRSRAAKAIGFIDDMINYSTANAPLQKELVADDVGHTAAFLTSPLASAITGTLIYVDNGLHAMGLAVDSPTVSNVATPAPEKPNVAT